MTDSLELSPVDLRIMVNALQLAVVQAADSSHPEHPDLTRCEYLHTLFKAMPPVSA